MATTHPLHLDLLPGRFAFARHDAGGPPPAWAFATDAALWSVTRRGDELSVVVEEAGIPPSVARVDRGWRALVLRGPVPFETTGVIAGLTAPLAAAGIPVTPIGTFDTDVLLVMERHLERAIAALRAAGATVETGAP
jgi:hypothetical protein